MAVPYNWQDFVSLLPPATPLEDVIRILSPLKAKQTSHFGLESIWA
jgi:hypothetical protein